jgi:DNA-binding transcriptional LysR family regulator
MPGRDESILDWYTFETGRLGVMMASDHPLAQRRQLSLQDLAGEHFIVVPSSSASPGHAALHSMCRRAGFEPCVVQEVDSIASMLNLVSIDMGIALSVIGKHFNYPPQIRMVPLRQVEYATSFVLGWLKGQKMPLVDALLDTIKGVAAGA